MNLTEIRSKTHTAFPEGSVIETDGEFEWTGRVYAYADSEVLESKTGVAATKQEAKQEMAAWLKSVMPQYEQPGEEE